MILGMFLRSVLSYTIFLASRKTVKGTLGLFETMKLSFELHRCNNCFKLYSGMIKDCHFCGEFCQPLYNIEPEEFYNNENYDNPEDKFLQRETNKQTQQLRFEPLKPKRIETHDRRNRANPEPSRGYQGRSGRPPRESPDNRRRSASGRERSY